MLRFVCRTGACGEPPINGWECTTADALRQHHRTLHGNKWSQATLAANALTVCTLCGAGYKTTASGRPRKHRSCGPVAAPPNNGATPPPAAPAQGPAPAAVIPAAPVAQRAGAQQVQQPRTTRGHHARRRNRAHRPRSRDFKEVHSAVKSASTTGSPAQLLRALLAINAREPPRAAHANDGAPGTRITRTLRDALESENCTKVTKLIEQQPRVPVDAALQEQLRPHYPASDFRVQDRGKQRQERITFDGEFVLEQLKRMHERDPAPGPDGVRASTLYRVFKGNGAACALLAKALELIVNDEVDDAATENVLRAAHGVPLLKPNGKVRPIAMAASVVNLASKCLIAKYRDKLATALDPADFGFGVSGAAEIPVHVLRAITSQRPNVVVIVIDIESAFNMQERAAIYSALKEHAPELAAFFNVKCRDGNNVLFKDVSFEFVVQQLRGIPQGCPASPFLFTLAYSVALKEARARAAAHSLAITLMDDTKLVCPSVAHALEFLDDIVKSIAESGLKVNVNKTYAFCKAGFSAEDVQRLATAGVATRPTLEILGTFVAGDPTAFLAKILKDYEDAIARYSQLVRNARADRSSPHHGQDLLKSLFTYARRSLKSKLGHLARTIPPSVFKETAKTLDRLTLQAFVELMDERAPVLVAEAYDAQLAAWRRILEPTYGFDVLRKEFPDGDKDYALSLIRALLPLRWGGAGLGSVYAGLSAAYAGSANNATRHVQALASKILGRELTALEAADIIPEYRDAFFAYVGGAEKESVPESAYATATPQLQHIISDIQAGKVHAWVRGVYAACDPSHRRAATFTSLTTRGAQACFDASTAFTNNRLDDVRVLDGLARATGAQPRVPATCASCKTAVAPGQAERHARACKGGAAAAGAAIKGGFADACSRFGVRCNTTSEPLVKDSVYFEATREDVDVEHRFDAVITNMDQPLYVDFACSSNIEPVRDGDRRTRACIPKFYEKEKRRKYEKNYSFPPDRLLIAACDPYGAWGDEMERFFKEELRVRIADEVERGRQVRYARQALSRSCLNAFHIAIHRLREPKATVHYVTKARRAHEQQQVAGEPQQHAQAQVPPPPHQQPQQDQGGQPK